MEVKLLKLWINRHGKEFKNGSVIDFGREKALKMVAEGVAVLVDVPTDDKTEEAESDTCPESDGNELDIY